MKTEIYQTLNGLTVIADKEDEGAPLLKLELCNELKNIPDNVKQLAASRAYAEIALYIAEKSLLDAKLAHGLL